MLGAYRLVAALTLVGVAVQVFLAGAGAFGATSYDAHKTLGIVLVVAGGLGLVLAALSRRQPARAVALELALLVQLLFGHLGVDHPWFGAFHGLLAIAVAALASLVARGVGIGHRGASTTEGSH